MCGIAGFYQNKYDFLSSNYGGRTHKNKWYSRLVQMKQSLAHRGPDDEHVVLFHHAGFAHTRLSIRDIQGGVQPMTCSYQGTTATIVYNGEIYNTAELRQKLSAYPLQWNTTGDTEVILNGFLAMGTSFFEELNGIFAFAIYVEKTGTLILVRDPLGVKPLFYQIQNDTLVFASEPKAIFAYGIDPSADHSCWNEIFSLGPARTPGNGGFAQMKEVLPGKYVTLTPRPSSPFFHFKEESFWSLY